MDGSMTQLHSPTRRDPNSIHERLLSDLNIRHEINAPLGLLTWYGVGGDAMVIAHPSSVQQLSKLAARCHEHEVPVYVLGAGANLLVRDAGVDGVVVHLDNRFWRQVSIKDHHVTAGAGHDLMKLVLHTVKSGLGGMEVLAGIPASVGGAIRMNAGGVFGDIGQTVHRVQMMDTTGHVYYRQRDELEFGYRKTNITAPYLLEVEFSLNPEDSEQLGRELKQIFLYKKRSQPLAAHSAGCAFKNPPRRDEDKPLTAGGLIDRAGLKGFRIGGAEVSAVHANFVVTHEGCRAADILAVMDHVQTVVHDHHGVQLEREVVVWP